MIPCAILFNMAYTNLPNRLCYFLDDITVISEHFSIRVPMVPRTPLGHPVAATDEKAYKQGQ